MFKKCDSLFNNITVNRVFYDQEAFYKENQDSKCQEECPIECQYFMYETTVSSAQFPTITYGEVLIKNENISVNYKDYDGNFENLKQSLFLFIFKIMQDHFCYASNLIQYLIMSRYIVVQCLF